MPTRCWPVNPKPYCNVEVPGKPHIRSCATCHGNMRTPSQQVIPLACASTCACCECLRVASVIAYVPLCSVYADALSRGAGCSLQQQQLWRVLMPRTTLWSRLASLGQAGEVHCMKCARR